MKDPPLPNGSPVLNLPASAPSLFKLAKDLAQWERTTGQLLDEAALRQRYPALMPELLVPLGHARQIVAAAGQAAVQPIAVSGADEWIHAQDEELTFLRQALTGYEPLESIDYGGQGLIYKAVQKSTNRIVALKVLLDGPLSSERQRRRFTREVEIISRLCHPNIVTLFDSGTVRGRQFFAMEFVDGLPIDDYVLLHRPAVKELVTLFEKICRAVASAHQRGIIHRDLKPSNILVDPQGEPHILDFGLAKELDHDPEKADDNALSVVGQVVGTLPYLSPEQAAGDTDVDVRSDIYSLGVILYESLTGAPPYVTSGPPEAVRANICSVEPWSFREAMNRANPALRPGNGAVPDDLERVTLRALAKDKNRRYQSAVELTDDLGRFLRGEAVQAKADSPAYVIWKTVQRYRTQAVFALVILFVLVGAMIGMGILWQRAERLAKSYQAGLELGSYLHLASVRRDEGRIDDAIEMLEAAVQMGKSIASPDNAAQRFHFGACQRLAELLLDRERFDEARVQAAAAYQLAATKVQEDSRNLEWRRLLGAAHRIQGRVALSEKDYADALKYFRQCADLREGLLAADQGNPSLLGELASIYGLMGQVSRAQDRHDDALAYYTRGHEIHARLNQAFPNSTEHELDLCTAELNLAVWHMDQKTPQADEKAAQWLAKIRERLASIDQEGRGQGSERDVARLQDAVARNLRIIEKRDSQVAPMPTHTGDEQ